MKRLSIVSAMLCLFALINTASANEYTSGNNCQANSGTVSYSWDYLYASTDAYVICPVTRTYSWINAAKIYFNYTPNAAGTCAYVNFISLDGSYTQYHPQVCASASGRTMIDFGNNPVDTQNKEGYLTFDISMPSGAQLAGVFSN